VVFPKKMVPVPFRLWLIPPIKLIAAEPVSRKLMVGVGLLAPPSVKSFNTANVAPLFRIMSVSKMTLSKVVLPAPNI